MNKTVLIAGGGPVGLMLACELALAGAEPIIIERHRQPNTQSWGVAINSAVIELLDQRGIMDNLRSDGLEFPRAQFAHLWLAPEKLSERHPHTFIVPQSQLERRLEEKARQLGTDIRRGQSVVYADENADGITVGINADSGEYSIQSRYLIGCDGVDSTVRNLAGIHFPGEATPFYGLTGDLEFEPGNPILGMLGAHHLPDGLFTLTPTGPGLFRILTGEFGPVPADRNAPVTLDELRARVKQITDRDLGEPKAHWLSRFDYLTRNAARYRSGRIFLAGDAAHVHFPLGGLALSTGLEDAVNLGWKLAADLDGWAPASLLDSYHDERHPAGGRACMATKAQVALLYPADKVAPLREIIAELIQFESVNEYLVKMAGGLDVTYAMDHAGTGTDGRRHPLLGRRLPDVQVTTPTGPTRVTALLHAGRGVLLAPPGDTVIGSVAADWANRIDVVAAEPWPEAHATALLLRPDGRVAWVGQDTADQAELRSAFTAWFGAPGNERGKQASVKLDQL
jgi:2-polyprenyl-6-methoxyphenol hydroxylase-like FAD-dependent oxidoreductase